MAKYDHLKTPVGSRFGQLVTIDKAFRRDGHTWIKCLCECGNIKEIQATELYRKGKRARKGCGHDRETSRHQVFDGERRVDSHSPEYHAWRNIKERCHNPSREDFARYGGRGIAVCERWHKSFSTFFADMGPKPSKRHTIERIDNAKGYGPDNCKWALPTEQQRNKRSNKNLTFQGQTMCVTAWAEVLELNSNTIWRRLKRGWSAERALTTAPMPPSFR